MVIDNGIKKKFCSKCRLYLDVGNFKKLTTKKSLAKNPDGYYWCCNDCFRKIEWVFPEGEEPNNRQARRRNKLAKRLIAIKSIYGLSESAYKEKITEQENLCAICGNRDNGKVLVIDHEHSTGRVRGLLCHNCNVGLGNMKEDVSILEAAIGYLKKWKDSGSS